MDSSHEIPVLFYAFAFAAIALFLYNCRRFLAVRIGKEEADRSAAFLSGVGNALTFGIGQRKVFAPRFAYPAVMHFLLAWGFIELFFATTVDFFVVRGWFVELLPGKDTPWFAALNDLGGLMLLVGLVLALWRRHAAKPEPLPQSGFSGRGNFLGDTGILLLLLLLVVGGFLAEAARLALEQPATASASWIGQPLSAIASAGAWEALEPGLWWSHAIFSLAFVALLPLTKMFHALAVIANVALTDRKRLGEVRPMHVSRIMEDPDVDIDNLTLGAKQSDELTWKQLLDSVACTECARCTTVCPAHATGKPLSPMKIITDIRQDLYQRAPARWAGEGETPAPMVGGTVTVEELWACTTCLACTEACPVLIDHVPTFTDLRRYLVLSEGQPPAEAQSALDGMMNQGNPWGLPRKDRLKWATDAGLEVPVMADKKKAEVLYWVGCAGAYDPRNQDVARSMVRIMQEAGVDFAVLGEEESCTGDSARRIGEEYLFETLALQNIEILDRYEFDRIVTPCPHCLQTLGDEYPAFEGDYEVVHHSTFLEELLASGRVKAPSAGGEKITFHDPCYLGRHNGIYDAPRTVLGGEGHSADLVEMPRSREGSFCCGAGGGQMWFGDEEGDRVNLERFREAVATGATTVATGCSFCLIMMDDAMKVEGKEEQVRVLDLAEVVAEGIEG